MKKTASGRIDARTGRPDSAYPMAPKEAQPSVKYVKAFTAALGLKPAKTKFGKKVVKV